MKYTTEEIIKKAREIHGDKYEYGEYLGYNTNMKIVCPKHGEFWQTPHAHLSGCGCQKCYDERRGQARKLSTEKFIEKAKKKYGDAFDYSQVDYVDSRTKVIIKCNKCGHIFEQRPAKHLCQNGCPECANIKKSLDQRSNVEDFIGKAKKVHGNKYDYSKFVYVNNKTKGVVICPIHGEFEITPNGHLSGNGCKFCGYEDALKKTRKTQEEFIADAKKIFGDTYSYDHVVYVNHHSKVLVTCKKHGDFSVVAGNHIVNRSGCPKCTNIVSDWEKEVRTFINELGVKIEPSNRSILKGKEIDIYLPDYKIGIECDGIKWHDEIHKDKNFHLKKTNDAKIAGVRLLHIFEDEWKSKQNIVESVLKNVLGKSERKIYARQCSLKEISPHDKRIFIEQNHIQGDTKSKVNLGLFFGDELVCVMTFGKLRINLGNKNSEGKWELVRFCNKLETNVIGGASKLLSHFKKHYDYDQIISYCDKRWSTGNMYEKIGFTLDHESKPNYFYVRGLKRENRFKYRKNILVEQGFDKNKSEHEIMMERKIYRIYDCGAKVYIITNPDKE